MRKCDCHNEVVGARASAPQEEAVKATYCNLFRGTPCKPRERVEIKSPQPRGRGRLAFIADFGAVCGSERTLLEASMRGALHLVELADGSLSLPDAPARPTMNECGAGRRPAALASARGGTGAALWRLL